MFRIILSFILLCRAVEASNDVEIFDWNNITDLAAIKWAHEVNSVSDLREALRDDSGLIEADVSYGNTFDNNQNGKKAVMSHDSYSPASDTLKKWLSVFLSENILRKGFKLDFKDSWAIPDAVQVLKQSSPNLKGIPIYLHTEILPAFVKENSKPITNWTLVKELKKLPFEFYYSLGWISYWDETIDIKDFGYTWTDIYRMYEILESENLQSHTKITFTVRAIYCTPKSLSPIFWLMSKIPKSRLSVWSHVQEEVLAIPILNTLLQIIPRNRMLFDIPRIFQQKVLFNSTESSCLRTSDSEECFLEEGEANFNGTISPIVLLSPDDVGQIRLKSFTPNDVYILKGSIETLNGEPHHSISIIDDRDSEIFTYTILRNVFGYIQLSNGTFSTNATIACQNCLSPSYEFIMQIDLANNIVEVLTKILPGSGEGRFKANWVIGPSKRLSINLRTDNVENAKIVFRTMKNPVVYHDLVGDRVKKPDHPLTHTFSGAYIATPAPSMFILVSSLCLFYTIAYFPSKG